MEAGVGDGGPVAGPFAMLGRWFGRRAFGAGGTRFTDILASPVLHTPFPVRACALVDAWQVMQARVRGAGMEGPLDQRVALAGAGRGEARLQCVGEQDSAADG